jgi:hypothetical protein
MNNWNHDDSCTLISLPLWDLENPKHFILFAQNVYKVAIIKKTRKVKYVPEYTEFSHMFLAPLHSECS